MDFYKICLMFCVICCFFSGFLIKNADGGVCGKANHNGSEGELDPHSENLAGETCKWHIFPKHHGIQETFLVFKEFELDSQDKCTVGKHNGSVLFGPFSGKIGTFSILAGYLYLDVVLETEKPLLARKFKLFFTAEKCDYYVDKEKGRIVSPLYHDTQRKYEIVTCTWRFRDFKGVNLRYWIKFDEFHLTNSTLHIKYDNYEKVLTGTDVPSEFSIPEQTSFELHLNTKIQNEKFSLDYIFGEHIVPEKTTPGEVGPTTTPVIINDIPLICGKTDYIEENGTITLGNTMHTTIDFECFWNINCENILNAKELHIQIMEFELAKEDNVTVLDSSGKVLFGSYHGKKEPFSILTGVLKLKFHVEISKKQKFVRKLKIAYNAKDCVNQLTNENGIVQLPIFESGKSKSITCSWTFSSPDKTFVRKISFMKHKFNGKLSLEGNIHPTNTYTQNNLPYILAKENGVIKLTFDTNSDNEFMFVYEKVISDCSSFIELTKETLISSALKDNAFDYWANCFWIVESPRDSVITLEIQKLNLINLQDYVIVTDGNSEKAPLLSQMNAGNQNGISKKEIISRNNSIIIFFHTQSVHVSEFEAKLSISKCPLFCDNGYCMLEKWKCDGINDCHDYTDEKDCNKTIIILPSVEPPMESKKSDSSNGVSDLAIGLAVPAAFVGGILVTIGIAAGKQMYRNRVSRDYGAFPIFNDP
ncbi:uncharacterized protein [Centruroides vittatus]|uniref:uncharacterized protein n=1 Tax=Centruroides vittatus TaxID=120091 RepID=UPI00350F94CB